MNEHVSPVDRYVGAGHPYARLNDAIAASKDGDRLLVKAGTYENDFATINSKISIIGVGGMVHLKASQTIPNGKGILITNTDVTLENIEFSGAKVLHGNGAGIRHQEGALVIKNSYFHDNQNGILTSGATTATVSIDHSEFARNGAGDGYTHGIYIGAIAKLTVTDSYFHDTKAGHHIKSRAAATEITGTRLVDGTANTSYNIDLPNGGAAVIRGNILVQGVNSPNRAIISYGAEGMTHATRSLLVEGNTIVNERAPGTAVVNHSAVTAQLINNRIYNINLISGLYTQNGTATLTTKPMVGMGGLWSTSQEP